MQYWVYSSSFKQTIDSGDTGTFVKIIKNFIERLTVVMFDVFEFLNIESDTIVEVTPLPSMGMRS